MSKNIWREFAELNGMTQEQFRDEIIVSAMAIMSMMAEKDKSKEISVTKGIFTLDFRERSL